MFRVFLAAAIFLAVPAFADDAAQPAIGALTLQEITTARQRLLDLPRPTEVVIDAGCCKVCNKGKACGNSCISRNYQCHKGPGCACDG